MDWGDVAVSGSLLTRERPDLDESQVMLDQVTLELLNFYEYIAAISDSASDLTMSGNVRDAAQTTLVNAMEVTESSGGVMIMRLRGAEETVASINSTHAVEEYARHKIKNGPVFERYEDDVRQRIAAADGSFLQSSFVVPLLHGESPEGILLLFSTKNRKYTTVDLKIVRVLAGQGTLSMRNLVNLEELEKKNASLSEALNALTTAQNDLVRSERFSALGEMASMIVHDIKNPMTGLLGYAQLMQAMAGTIGPEQIGEYSGLIIEEMRRLSRMTEEIMDFSQGMSSKLARREMLPLDLINTAWPILKSDLEGHAMSLQMGEVENSSLLSVDSDKVERVFINLAVNARQAMKKDGTLTVSARRTGRSVEFSFRDTGSGISDEFRKSLFEPFVTRKKGHSLGIGLSMSQWIVEAHGGDLRVADTGPAGTEMTVRLPVSGKGR